MKLIRGEGLTRTFGGITALLDIDFSLEPGEIFGLIGPNGAGKTTLFNVITGTCPPTRGRLFFEENPLSGLSTDRICRLGIARTYQLVRTFQGLSVLENVLVGAFYGSGSESVTTERNSLQKAVKGLDFLGIGSLADYPVENLTMSQRKKVEIARALATDPKLLLLDEVMAGLNPTEIEEMMGLIKKIQSRGVTMMLIEHHMQAVMTLSDRVLAIHYGQKIAEGTPQVVAHHPKVIEAYLGE